MKFSISVVSDTVCPWCYVGKQKLEQGIAAYQVAHPQSGDTFAVTYHPFYLNPEAPKVGIDKKEFYRSKFGDAKAAAIFERLGAIGKDVGINFSFGGKTGNTRDSHRLIQLGKTKGPDTQTRIVEELFAAYFEHEKDITDHDTLREAGVRAGVPETEVTEWLKGDDGGKDVDREVLQAQTRGISGVPNFVLQDKYEIGGAQDPQAFASAFERIRQREG